MKPYSRTIPAHFQLSSGFTILRLQNLASAEQVALLPKLFALIEEQYPEWPAETVENWLASLHGGNENGTKMAVSVVVDDTGQPQGLSALELYRNGTAMISYSVALKCSPYYLAIVYTATKDMMAGVREWQARGEMIDFVGKEHHLNSDRAIAGYYAVGQVPIDGPSTLLSREVKYYEVAYGDPANCEDLGFISHSMKLADPKTGKNHDEVVHLWLIDDFIPSHPKRPLSESLRALAETYPLEHSIYRKKDYRLDPAYRSLNSIADALPQHATYQQAVSASTKNMDWLKGECG